MHCNNVSFQELLDCSDNDLRIILRISLRKMYGIWSIMQKIAENFEQNNARNYEHSYLSPNTDHCQR